MIKELQMNGRFPLLQRAVARRLALGLLMAVLALLLTLNLAGCGKKQQQADIETGPEPPAEITEPVELPVEKIPVVDEQAKPEEVVVPKLDLRPVFFDFDKFALTPEARATLNTNGRLLKDRPGVKLIIEGHCDERGTAQYNLALGEKRARVARDYLVDLGIASSRLEIVSYGKERPFASGHNEAAWSQNRRAHFVQRETGK